MKEQSRRIKYLLIISAMVVSIIVCSHQEGEKRNIATQENIEAQTSDIKANSFQDYEAESALGQPSNHNSTEAESASRQPSNLTSTEAEYLLGQPTENQTTEAKPETTPSPYDFTICFAGDMNLADNGYVIPYMDTCENGIFDCIDQTLVQHMQDADIMCINNEFTYSDGGSPLEGKAYTFRAKPERVQILKDLGVDIVCLANNHVYDYGKQALYDTFTTLEEAEIPYFGAGRTLEEAKRPTYIEVDGKIIAFVGASRAEKYKLTPQATEDSPGILRCYDTELVLEEIKEAREKADIVLVYVHWGTEYSDVLEPVQREDGKAFIDAGADVVIGAHSHCLQGMEFYNGKPILYSMGNYWFNQKTLDSMLVELHFTEDEPLEITIVPALQAEKTTRYVDQEDKQRQLFDYLESISINAKINDAGILYEAASD